VAGLLAVLPLAIVMVAGLLTVGAEAFPGR